MAGMPDDCLFCRIVAGEIPATVVHDGERTLAFRDLSPQAPTHVLVISKNHHANASALAAADPDALVELHRTAAAVAQTEGIADTGYRLVYNTGRDGHQSVDHVHLHLLGGRGMGWPPG
jgi:histidine triad (HIT) family protein